MHRIDSDGNINFLFSEGNVETGTPGTRLTADWLNDVQENLLYLIESVDMVPEKGNYALITNAITYLIQTGGTIRSDFQKVVRELNASYLYGSKNIFRQPEEPEEEVQGPFFENDIWYDTDHPLKLKYLWNGLVKEWIDPSSEAAGRGVIAVQKLAAIADGVIDIYTSFTEPPVSSEGDIWFNDTTNALYIRDNNEWFEITDQFVKSTIIDSIINSNAALARGVADSKIRTHYVDTEPTGLNPEDSGDLWFDTNDGNKPYVYDHPVWVPVQDGRIQKAMDLIFLQAAIADGTIFVYFSAVEPDEENQAELDPPNPAPSEGDLWLDISLDGDDEPVNDPYLFVGGEWIEQTDPELRTALISFATQAAIADGSITFYFQDTEPDELSIPVPRYGDVWFDTGNVEIEDETADDPASDPTILVPGYTQYRYDGTDWLPIEDFRVKLIFAKLKIEELARAEADTAISGQITEAYTTIEDNQASIQQALVSINGVATSYGVISNINGDITGFGLLTDYEAELDLTYDVLSSAKFIPGDMIYQGVDWASRTYEATVVAIVNPNGVIKVIAEDGTFTLDDPIKGRDRVNAYGVLDDHTPNPTPGESEFRILADRFVVTDGTEEHPPFVFEDGVLSLGEVNVDGDLVVNGTLSGNKIIASTIGASRMLITDMHDMIMDQNITDPEYWELLGGTVLSTSSNITNNLLAPSGVYMAGTGMASGASSEVRPYANFWARVEAERPYRVKADIRKIIGFTGRARLLVTFYEQDKVTSVSSINAYIDTDHRSVALAASATVDMSEIIASPPNASWVMLRLYVDWSTTLTNAGGVYWANPSMTRATNAELIVDGSISADKLSANFGTFESYLRVGATGSTTDAFFVAGNNYSTTHRMWAGSLTPTVAPFSVTKAGGIRATDLNIFSPTGELILSSLGLTDYGRNLFLLGTGTFVNPIVKILTSNTDKVDVQLVSDVTVRFKLSIPNQVITEEFGSGYGPPGGTQYDYPPYTGSDPFPTQIVANIQRSIEGGAWSTIETITLNKNTHYEVQEGVVEEPYGWDYESSSSRWRFFAGIHEWRLVGKSPYLLNGGIHYAGSGSELEQFLDFTLSTADEFSFRVAVSQTGGTYTMSSAARTLTMTDIDPGRGFITGEGGISGGDVVNADTLGGNPPSYFLTSGAVSGGTLVGSFTSLVTPSLVSRVAIVNSVNGTLSAASHANRQLYLNGNITAPNTGFVKGDYMAITADGSNRTLTRGASSTMYVNGVNTASVTIPAYCSIGLKYTASNVYEVLGIGVSGGFDASDITSGVFATARLGSGTADSTKYLRGDGTWQTYSTGGTPAWADVTGKPASLVSIAGLTTAANKMIYSTASDTYAVTDLSAFARTILDDADGAAVRTTIGAAATSHSHAASDVTSGTFDAARIPSLAASIITSGTFDAARIPSLAASIITSGVLDAARLGSGTADSTKYLRGDGTWQTYGGGGGGPFDTSDITTGVFDMARLGTGTADDTKYLRGDGTWQVYSTGGAPSWTAVTDKPDSLVSIAGLTTAADKMIYSTALDTYAVTDLSSFARTILDDADGSAVRTTIGAAAASHNHAASDITSGVLATARLGSGTADSTKYLRGDGTWQDYGGGGGSFDDTDDYTLSGTWQFNNYVSINTPQRYGFAFELNAVSHGVSQTRNGYALRGNATDDGTGWLGGLFMESTGSGVPSVSIYGPLDSTAGANTTQKAVEVYGSGGTQRIRLHAYGQQRAEFGDSGLELSGISTETKLLRIGVGRSGTGASHLQLIGDTTYSAWGTTLYRDDNSGANSNSWLRHRGTGQFVIQTNEAADILFQTSATSRMTINSSGEVDFGTSTVQSSGLIRTRRNGDNIEWGHTNTGGYGATLGCASGSGYPYISFNCMAGATSNTFKTVGRTGNVIYGNATGGIVFQYVSNSSADNQSASTLSTLNTSGVWSAADFSATSDRRIKDNIIDFDNALEKIRKLKPRYFNFKGDDQRKIGFVAQEIEKILPEVVTTSDEPVNGIRNFKSVSHGNVVAVVVGATKELDSEVTTLKKRIDKLEKMVARLLRRAA